MTTYVIHYSDPLKTPFLINRETVNARGQAFGNTSLQLYGQNSRDWGEGVDENLLHIMENFAGATPPYLASVGQDWYRQSLYYIESTDASTLVSPTFYRYVNGAWVDFSTLVTQNVLSNRPMSGAVGTYFFATDTQELFRWDFVYTMPPAGWQPRAYQRGTVNPTSEPMSERLTWSGSSWTVPTVFTVPLMSSDPLTVNAKPGQIFYDTSVDKLRMFDGTIWDYVVLPSGSDTQVQYNNGGQFAGDSNFTWVSGTSTLSTANLNFGGTGRRITGDFNNASVALRTFVQTSATNGNTNWELIPNGTATSTSFNVSNGSDPTNASLGYFSITSSDVRIQSASRGTGTQLPITLYTGGSERVRIDTSGNIGVGRTPNASNKFEVTGYSVSRAASTSGSANVWAQASNFWETPLNSGTGIEYYGSTAAGNVFDLTAAGTGILKFQEVTRGAIYTNGSVPIIFGTASTEKMRLTSNGDLGIGSTSPQTKLQVDVSNPANGVVTIVRNSGTSALVGSQVQFSQNTVGDWTIGQPANENAFAVFAGRSTATSGTEIARFATDGSLRVNGLVRSTANGFMFPDDTTQVTTATLAPSAIQYFALSSAPAGWLKANGAAVSRTVYSALFSAIGTTYGVGDGSTTFNLPDLRGEFIRGWDDGRGVDAGRVLGTSQADLLRSHTHPFTAAFVVSFDRQFVSGGNSQSFNQSLTTGASGGAETRPRNVALLACIKF